MRAHRLAAGISLTLALGLALVACKPEPTATQSPDEGEPAAAVDAWAVYQELEAKIAGPGASEAERKAALEQVRLVADDGSARFAFARAAVAGRLAETRGLKALKLLDEMKKWSEESIARDPDYDGMAATRMLGTLHALAGQHFEGGDSELGLELLESVVDAHGDAPRNHLRLAEGYVALGDPESAFDSLCTARAGRDQLDAEEQGLLDGLLEDIGGAELLPCPEGSAEGSP